MAAVTILLTTESLVGCCQFRGGRVISLSTGPRLPGSDQLSAIDAAMRHSPGTLGPVWVLTTSLWTQSMTVDALVAARIPMARMPRFLSLEAEPLSGVNPQDSAAAAVAVGDSGSESTFWFAQMPAGELEQIEQRIASAGGRLRGVAHPAGVPVPVAIDRGVTTEWGRLEIWSDLIVCLHAGPGRSPRVGLIPRTVGSDDWQPQADAWFAEQGTQVHWEMLQENQAGLTQPLPFSGTVYALDDQNHLNEWLQRWAQVIPRLGKRVTSVPVLRPAAKPMPARTRNLATIGLLALAIIGCVGHAFWLENLYYPAEKERLSAELAQVQAPAAKLKTINEQFQQVEKTRTSLATDNQGLKSQLGQSRQVVANYRRRIGALLGGLSDYDNDYLVVHAISSDADQLRISGRCMEPRLASGLAQRLASRLSELGLEIAPPTCEATYVQPNGAPFDFELTIRERPGGENAGASRQPPPATAQR